MRDPQGILEFDGDKVIRRLYSPLGPADFLFNDLARSLAQDGSLIDYDISCAGTVVSPRTPFVSYPHEWSDAQLADAAELTLKISQDICIENFELKDASAWNIVFNGTVPQFCDHLSFQPIRNRSWWAFAQFIRHFIFPLSAAKFAGLNAKYSFKIDRDGLQPDHIRTILGARRYLTRYWPLMLKANLSKDKLTATKPNSSETEPGFHKNLYALTRWLLNGVKPKQGLDSHWSDYVASRDHYSSTAQRIKHETISRWIEDLHPSWVIDFGCNTGEFSVLAASKGAQVVSIDLDHDCIQQLYISQRGNKNIFPLVANLDDISGGQGWAGSEFKGLIPRLESVGEMSLMLALIHHLAISNSIPYDKIAELARKVSKKWLIVELLDEQDPLVILLSNQRDRNANEFTLDKQLGALEIYFNVLEKMPVEGTHRHLVLLASKTL